MNIQVFDNGKQSLKAIEIAAKGARRIFIGVAYVTKGGLDFLLPYLKRPETWRNEKDVRSYLEQSHFVEHLRR